MSILHAQHAPVLGPFYGCLCAMQARETPHYEHPDDSVPVPSRITERRVFVSVARGLHLYDRDRN